MRKISGERGDLVEARLTGIDRFEALRYLGYRGQALPPDAENAIARCERMILDIARPRAVWRRFGLRGDMTLEGTELRLRGEDIRARLAGCEGAILMAATLGHEIEALIRQTQVRSMADAMILDACASAAVENVCDNLCRDIQDSILPMLLTERYSPGYGDFPLTQQEGLFRVLDITRRIGVTLTASGLMLPQKTVTAVLGVSDAPVKSARSGCEGCGLYESCAYRKDGKSCGK